MCTHYFLVYRGLVLQYKTAGICWSIVEPSHANPSACGHLLRPIKRYIMDGHVVVWCGLLSLVLPAGTRSRVAFMGYCGWGICSRLDWAILGPSGGRKEAFIFERSSVPADWSGMAHAFYLPEVGTSILIPVPVCKTFNYKPNNC